MLHLEDRAVLEKDYKANGLLEILLYSFFSYEVILE